MQFLYRNICFTFIFNYFPVQRTHSYKQVVLAIHNAHLVLYKKTKKQETKTTCIATTLHPRTIHNSPGKAKLKKDQIKICFEPGNNFCVTRFRMERVPPFRHTVKEDVFVRILPKLQTPKSLNLWPLKRAVANRKWLAKRGVGHRDPEQFWKLREITRLTFVVGNWIPNLFT